LPTKQQNRRLAAVLSTDAVGYSRLMGQDEARTVNTLKVHFEVMRSLIGKFRGRVVDVHGDNLLAEFASVVNAVQCALEIQKELNARNGELTEESRMLFRIGINLGDVIEEAGNIYGDGVNVAARLEGLADPGGICISRSVHDQVKNKLNVEYQSLGAVSVKNIAEPVRVFRVLQGPPALGKTISTVWYRLKKWQKVALAVALALLQVVWGVALKRYLDPPGTSSGIFAFLGQRALPQPDKPSIAVLPFENMTGDPKQEYFVDGFTEQIITSLAKSSSLFVISRNSSFTYKGKPVKVQKVSEELGIRYVLEGSIQRSGDRVRINAQLIDAVSGEHRWSENYDRSMEDIFALQDEINLKILTALQVTLTTGEQARVWAKGTKNLDAYLKLMQARENLYQINLERNATARQLAEETIALDPKCAEAYALKGATYLMDMWLGSSKSPKDSLAQAIVWTRNALAIDNSLADAHARLGYLYVITPPHRYEEGVAEAEKAVMMDPNAAVSHYFLGMALRFAGRQDEAIRAMKKAIRLEPFTPGTYYQNLGLSYLLKGDCGEAVKACEKALERERDNMMAYLVITAVYSSCGMEKEAGKTAKELLRLSPEFSAEAFAKKLPYKNPKNRELVIEGLRKAGL
jgi:adenylate cyclase